MEVTQKDLAACLGLSSRQVRNLRQQGLFQLPEGVKKYRLEACVQEYIRFKVTDETGRKGAVSTERVKAEHEVIKKDISVLKLRKLRRETHEAAAVEHYLTNMLTAFRGRILLMPAKVAIKIIGETDVNKVISIIEAACNEALAELSEYDPDEIDGTIGETVAEDETEEGEDEEE